MWRVDGGSGTIGCNSILQLLLHDIGARHALSLVGARPIMFSEGGDWFTLNLRRGRIDH